MPSLRIIVLLLAALSAGACARRAAPAYVMIDPATGQQVYASTQRLPPSVVQYTPPQAPPQSYAQPYPNQAYPNYAAPGVGGVYVAPPAYGTQSYGTRAYSAYASASPTVQPSYSLDTGDRLRIVVFGQDGISNSYIVDAAGNVNLPLIGAIPARGTAPQQLARIISDRLRQGYVREPHVSVEVETYRPFFILGEVTNPGQYAYVPNMTAETAVAIAGGFAPRAKKTEIELTRNSGGQQFHGKAPLATVLRPGDTIIVQERWF